MSWLSKLARKALGGKAVTLKNVVKAAAGKAVGTIPGGTAVLRAAKALAVKPHAAAVKVQPVSVRAVISKAVAAPPRSIAPPTLGAATRMPGGAPIASGSPRKAKRRMPRGRAATDSGVGARGHPTRAGKRRAPSGGKDFKALSAAWRAAGKPGTWLAWVKSH